MADNDEIQMPLEDTLSAPLLSNDPTGPKNGALKVFMHVGSVLALFAVFKMASVLLQKNAPEKPPADAPAVVQPAAKAVTPPSASSSAAGSKDPFVIGGTSAPAPAPASAPEAAAIESINGAVAKSTSCDQLQNAVNHWSSVMKSARTEDRKKWVLERMNEAKAQSVEMHCAIVDPK